MLQNRKKRLQKFFIIMLLSALGTSLVLFSLNSKLDLFYSPSEMLAADIKPGYRIKLGGMVEIGSIQREGTTIFFVVTDFEAKVPVSFEGVAPDLFKENSHQELTTLKSLPSKGFYQLVFQFLNLLQYCK